MSKVSILIPACNEPYWARTVDEVFEKARGEIEVITILDGSHWPTEFPKDRPNLTIIHGARRGMRGAVNACFALAKGEFVMKYDAHCSISEGFDLIFQADCDADWVVTPRRYSLDAETWQAKPDKPSVEYEYLNPELRGRAWPQRKHERKGILVDEDMSFQGSCYFMRRAYWEYLELLDDVNYASIWNEAQEVGLKAWLSGGRLMVNKKVDFLHWHKLIHRGYAPPPRSDYVNRWKEGVQAWHKQIYPLSWLVERFAPVPEWPAP